MKTAVSMYIVFWKSQMDDVFFVWRGKKEDLELFVWLLNGIENKVQFTLGKTDHKSIQKANPHATVHLLEF